MTLIFVSHSVNHDVHKEHECGMIFQENYKHNNI